VDLWSRTSYLLFGSELTTHGGNGAIPTGRDGAASGHQLCQDGRSTCDTQGRPRVAYHDVSMQVIPLCLTPSRIASIMILVTSTAATTAGGVSSLHQCA
jgi:hypothetical protein